jgi:hypothetical protein
MGPGQAHRTCRNVDHWSPAMLPICHCGIRFSFEHVLRRNRHTLALSRSPGASTTGPSSSPREQVRRLLSGVGTPHDYAFLAFVLGSRSSHPDRPQTFILRAKYEA